MPSIPGPSRAFPGQRRIGPRGPGGTVGAAIRADEKKRHGGRGI